MTLKEFETYNRIHNMPYKPIGQGMGYKSQWDPERPDDIIYIPENAYEEYGDGTIIRGHAYSVRDFLALTDDNIQKAKELYEFVDWQYPETVIEEGTLKD